MSFENRRWVIITIADYVDESSDNPNEQLENLVANAIQTSVSTLRKSLNGAKAILKWDGDTPGVFDGMTTYSHAEILIEMAKSTWTEADN
tara:strand:- start:33 stop:302 length:270 start_codon:yes stop_codon:yes gene_type:complete